MGESIDYGEKEPNQVIVELLIDDEIPSRQNRINIFHNKFNKISCSTGPHMVFGCLTVIDYIGSNEKTDKDHAYSSRTTKETISDKNGN